MGKGLSFTEKESARKYEVVTMSAVMGRDLQQDLYLQFENEQAKSGFLSQLIAQCGDRSYEQSFRNIDEHTIAVVRSTGQGTRGTYISLNGELSISFGPVREAQAWDISKAFFETSGLNSSYLSANYLKGEEKEACLVVIDTPTLYLNPKVFREGESVKLVTTVKKSRSKGKER